MSLRGLESVEFVCPDCKGKRWSSEGNFGRCKGRAGGLLRCGFQWSRRHDYRVFHYVSSGAAFASQAELDRAMALELGPASLRRALAPLPPSFEELLHGLLAEVMTAPPTVGVIERWTRQEQRGALSWVSREILLEDDPEIVRLERPAFIVEGEATA